MAEKELVVKADIPCFFDLAFKSWDFTLSDSTGKSRVYKIKELDGAGRDQFLTLTLSKARFNDKGQPIGAKDANGCQSTLLCRCVYDDADKLVEEKEIAKWPARVQDALFKKASEMSGLDKAEAEAEAKNA